jgi:hypothetical protein
MPRNYSARELVYVKPSAAFSNLAYGFNTGLADGKRADFGQVAVNLAALPAVFVVGANSPKPARVTVDAPMGTYTSFADYTKIATLKADGGRVKRGKSRAGSASASSKVVYVTIRGVKYAWNFVAASGVDTAELGLIDADASNTDLVFGASFPKPARYKKKVAQGYFSSFVDPTAESGLTGYTKVSPAITTYSE